MTPASARRERRQFEIERDFVPQRATLPAPARNHASSKRSSITLPAFHGISFRRIREKTGRYWLRAGYHQLDGSWELADSCTCGTEWDPDFRVVRSGSCPIDDHKIAAQRAWGRAGEDEDDD